MLTEHAYAKINLHLAVLRRRADGYHDLQTVMQTVDLSDTVTLSVKEAERLTVGLICDDPTLPTDESNLAHRAATAYCEAAKIQDVSLNLTLEKRIPLAAGLAGGSADAAAVLRLLNRFFGNRLTKERLLQVGKRLGADVPFCLVGGTCLCEGIGDVLTPLDVRPDYFVVVAKAQRGVSTSEAFRLLDALHVDFEKCPRRLADPLCQALSQDPLGAITAHAYNCFEEVILPIRPEVAAIQKVLLAKGALTALMSGSGPSVFGIFAEAQKGKAAVNALQAQGVFATLCRPTVPLIF